MAILDQVSRIKKGEITSKELVNQQITQAEQSQKKYNLYTAIFKESALEKASKIDGQIKSGAEAGPLAGVPLAIKDNMLLRKTPTTCASKILEGYISPYTATAVKKLIDAGAVIMAKTNMDEFAMGSSGETSYYGPTLNPRDPERIPGGSSSGSAASVAAGDVPAALGSDTGGSIRQPSAMCGVVGVKPTYGLVSRYGLVAFASSLDQIGPLAESVEDAALILSVIAGYDPLDSTSLDVEIPDYLQEINNGIQGMTIGIPEEYMAEGLSEEIRKRVEDTAKEFEKSGAAVKSVSLPRTKYAVSTYYIVAPAEASANLARYDGVKYGYRTPDPADLLEEYTKTRDEGFGAEVKRRIMLGTYALSSGYYEAYYLKAQKVRTLMKNDFDNAFKEVDLILSPTAPDTAFKLGEKTEDPLQMYLSDIYTISCNLAGIPGVSVPAGKDSKGLPIGLQLMGPHLSENKIFKAARQIEKIYE